MSKTLTDAERIARDKHREEKEKQYTKRWAIRTKLLNAKILKAGITVTSAEVDAEMKRLGLVK